MSETMATRLDEAARLLRRYQHTDYQDAALAFMRATVEQTHKASRERRGKKQ